MILVRLNECKKAKLKIWLMNRCLEYSLVGTTRAFGAVGVGSLDPEERKRLLVRGSSFALKNRDRSF